MGSPSNVPLPLNSLVGRHVQIAEVTQLLSTTRLLTLTGVGGCGKTRLALAVADELAQAFSEGVWLAELAPLADPALVPLSLARVLGIQEAPPRPLIEVLIEYLRPRAIMLVLDNCEHLVLACARMVEALLRACPRLRILCTSREALGVAGEVVYQVPVLPAPDSRHPPLTTAGYLQFAAVQLFVERAAAAQPSFVLTEQNATAVAQICQQLDGIPLAIELAASRVRTLPVEGIAGRLANDFRFLRTGERTAPPRQQTLQAALDWSYALLTPPEQALLMHLSVFAGGWTLAAAETVCEERDAPVLDLLSRLVDKSLVIANVAQGRASRYHLLEPVRQYARYRLWASGDLAAIRDRHLRFYLAWAEAAWPLLRGPEQVSWLNDIEDDHDNLRAAFEWGLERLDGSPQDDLCHAPLRLANALPLFYRIHGHVGEGRRRLAAALKCCKDAPALMAAAALVQAAWLANDQSDYDEAISLAGQSLALYQSRHDNPGIALSLYQLAIVANHRGEFAHAQELVEESLGLWRGVGDREGIALALDFMAILALNQGDYSRARQVLEQSRVLWRELNNLWGIAWQLTFSGWAADRLRDYDSAEACFIEALAIFQELGDQRGKAGCTEMLAEVMQGTGNLMSAGAGYVEALALFQRIGIRWSIAQCLQKLGTVACAQHRYQAAACLLGAGNALHDAIQAPVNPADRIIFDHYIKRTCETLGARKFAAAWQAGQAMTIEDAVAYASAYAETAKGPALSPLQAAKAAYGGLTARERQVAALVAQGRSNREIAEILVVTERTAAVHVSNILAKLNLASRTQIATWAVEKGLVE